MTDPLAYRVAARFLAKAPEVPVENQDSGRIVYVLPETMKDDPSLYKPIPPNETGDPRYRGKPKPPARPAKPHRPEIPRDTNPAPIKPPIPVKRVKPTKPVKPVPVLKQPKVPEPSPHREWEKRKDLMATRSDEHVGIVVRVLNRWVGD